MKKTIKTKQTLKGIFIWIVLITMVLVFSKVIIKISNPHSIPTKQLEQIQVEEGLK